MAEQAPVRVANIGDGIAGYASHEVFTTLFARAGVRIERIVSSGQATPAGETYDQPGDEWVLLVEGAARLWIEGQGDVALAPGDHLLIPAHRRHRVSWTRPDGPTIWLAVHLAP